jgi:hypothetical protein
MLVVQEMVLALSEWMGPASSPSFLAVVFCCEPNLYHRDEKTLISKPIFEN